MRVSLDHGNGQAAGAQVRFKPASQCFLIQGQAVARAVQCLDRCGRTVIGVAVLWFGVRRGLRHFGDLQ